MEDFLMNLLQAVIIAGIPVIMTFLIKLIQAKQKEIAAKIKNDYAKDMFEDVMSIITRATQYTTQTFVDTLKANGTFNTEAAHEAFDTTLSTVKSLLTDEMSALLIEKYGDLNTFLTVQIEAVVQELKKNQ